MPIPSPRPVLDDPELSAAAREFDPSARVVLELGTYWHEDRNGRRDLGPDRKAAAVALIEYLNFLRGALFTGNEGAICKGCGEVTLCYVYDQVGPSVARCPACQEKHGWRA